MSTYYQDSDEWSKRVHLLPNGNSWRGNWPHAFRDDMIITPHGIFMIRREDGYTYARPATRYDASRFLMGAGSGQRQGGGVELPVKLSFSLLTTAVRFFSVVWQQFHREDILLLYFNEQQRRYGLHHPQLKAAGAGFVDYEVPTTAEGWIQFGSLHSHGHEPAFQSQTDMDDDLESPGLHLIIGSLDQATPTLHCVFSHSGHCFSVPPQDVFIDDQRSTISFPEKWIQAAVPMGPRQTTLSVPKSHPGGPTHVSGTNRCAHAECPLRRKVSIDSDWPGGD